MKGALENESGVFEEAVLRGAFSNGHWASNVSGGIPSEILKLTNKEVR